MDDAERLHTNADFDGDEMNMQYVLML